MRDPLFVNVVGEGTPVVLLHGWGMHAGLFQPLVTQLAQRHRVLAVDLPGHGESEMFDGFAERALLTNYIKTHLRKYAENEIVLIGWSLGGLLAQTMAMQFPADIRKLVLLCSTPCFVRRDDWQAGMNNSVLETFAKNLQLDFEGTLSRFLSLQFLGVDGQKHKLREARRLLQSKPAPRPRALEQGLQLLQSTDLRTDLGQISCPALVINGEHDTLVPPVAGQFLANQLVNGRYDMIEGAGHAPFLSHPEALLPILEKFL